MTIPNIRSLDHGTYSYPPLFGAVLQLEFIAPTRNGLRKKTQGMGNTIQVGGVPEMSDSPEIW